MEVWRDIDGYEGLYQVSNLGNVKSLLHTVHTRNGRLHRVSERIMKHGRMTSGYAFVGLTKDKACKNHAVHRLVARAFIPNPKNYPDVNHIDGNKLNNIVDNLEWCSRSYNLRHAIDIGLVESQCKVRRKVTIKCGEKIVAFDTMQDCAQFFGFKKSWLHNRIRKHGLTFSYQGYEISVSERRGFKSHA